MIRSDDTNGSPPRISARTPLLPDFPMHAPRRWTSPRLKLLTLTALIGSLSFAGRALAHDFWIIPDLFTFAADPTVHLSARAGTKFPEGTAVQLARIADARIIGANGEMKITDMAVDNGALRLHQRPTNSGQYLVVVGLTPSVTRSIPLGLLRFLRAEGGAAEADRIEAAHTLAGQDSVVFHAASYASTVVQVGRGGPKAFTLSAGAPLQFAPVSDPLHLHVGDTLQITMLGLGKPVAGLAIEAKPAADITTSAATLTSWLTLKADAKGVVSLPLVSAGAWILRSAFVSAHSGGAVNEYDIARATYVLSVGAKH